MDASEPEDEISFPLLVNLAAEILSFVIIGGKSCPCTKVSNFDSTCVNGHVNFV